ncbi:Membrane protein [uncultured Gammaproteobacteria bacterium]
MAFPKFPFPSVPAATEDTPRFALIDAARGVAVAVMIAYHLCWDLTFFGLARFNLFHDPLWLVARSAIVSGFLFLVGVGLVLGERRGRTLQGPDRRGFLLRLGVIASAALAVTLGSLVFFPDSPILFGVLHHIALASVIGLAFLPLPPAVVAIAAAACVATPWFLANPMLSHGSVIWLGLGTFEPRSNDFVPLLPWFGAVLAGIALTRAVLVRVEPGLAAWRPEAGPARLLVWSGRRSLLIYLVHQPVLLAALFALVATTGLGVPGGTFVPASSPPSTAAPISEGLRRQLASCQVNCEKNGGTLNPCSDYCHCAIPPLMADTELWAKFGVRALSADEQKRVEVIVSNCTARHRRSTASP